MNLILPAAEISGMIETAADEAMQDFSEDWDRHVAELTSMGEWSVLSVLSISLVTKRQSSLSISIMLF